MRQWGKVAENLSNKNWKKIVDQLVIENCLVFGEHSKFTQKKVAKYLLGTRATFEIFKLYELRYLLLKVYPFIQNLFYNPRLSSTLKIKKLWNQNYKKQLETQRKLGTRLPANQWKPKVRIIGSFVQKEKNLTPQILFATVTPMYTDIIKAAAYICNMPSHGNRWLSGSITAAISYEEDHLRWNYLTDDTQTKILFNSTQKWSSNKENPEKTKEKLKYHGESRWPSLIIIPDLSNNTMILKEAKKIGIPVMGLVNSSTPFQIDYPIFAQDQTIHSVHFFCHFLATLIAKEMVYFQHKRYLLQKKKRKIIKLKHKNILKNKFCPHILQSQTRHQPFWRHKVFFRIVKPINDWKVPDLEWHQEYSSLKPEGPYFLPRFWFRRKKIVRDLFGLQTKFTPHSLNKNLNSSVFKKTFFSYRLNKNNKTKRKKKKKKFKINKIKKIKKIKKTIKIKKTKKTNKQAVVHLSKKIKTFLKDNIEFKSRKYFRSWYLQRNLKILGRYLVKKKRKVALIKKQKYLSLIFSFQKQLRMRYRLTPIRKFLKQETLKKYYVSKKKKRKSFFMISEQRLLWRKMHQFLIWNKVTRLQIKNKLLHFQIAKFHTQFKNYYGETLRFVRQITQFQSPKHALAPIFNDMPYKVHLVEAQYYDARPGEWKAEKARRYKMLSQGQNFKKSEHSQQKEKLNPGKHKKKWSTWTNKNRSTKEVRSSKKKPQSMKQSKEFSLIKKNSNA